jgi:beta-lactam-binding protein with PASTA domain
MEPKKTKEGRKKPKEPIQHGLNWKRIGIQVGIMLGLFLLLVFIIGLSLKSYTHHSESLTVPDFKGMTIEEVERECNEKDLRYLVKDSVFSQDAPRNTIVDQNPKPLSKVKRNRRIYLSLNAKKAPKVSLPNIIDISRRQAVKILESIGIKASDKIEYKSDPALNAVLEVKYRGLNIEPGASLQKGSVVDLVLGDGGNSQKAELPDLTGKTFEEAMLVLRASFLNVGKITTDSGKVVITAKSNSIIYKQEPKRDEDNKQVSQGESINIWVMPAWKYKKKMNE